MRDCPPQRRSAFQNAGRLIPPRPAPTVSPPTLTAHEFPSRCRRTQGSTALIQRQWELLTRMKKKMIARLHSLNDRDAVDVIPLESLPVTLGRGAAADVRILDQCASRLHCRILQVENELVVQDLGSTLGTLVNGQPIAESRLCSGDSLTVGTSTFRVDLETGKKTSLLSRIEASIKSLGTSPRESKPQVAGS